MRIVFMGTPDFAVPSLDMLIQNKYEVCAVLCQPDKPQGRGHKLQSPPVKLLAEKAGVPVWQPATLKDDAIRQALADLMPDCIVVVAYGKLLPESILQIPPLGCINVHGSLLPKYRGAGPIQHAVLNGEAETGVTTMYMAKGMDTGDMILQRRVAINPDETAGALFDRLKLIGADLLHETLRQVESGIAPRLPQEDAQATYAPMLRKEDAYIDWHKPARQLYNLVRGMNPWPCAYTALDGKTLKVHRAEIVKLAGLPGRMVAHEGYPLVYCGEDALRLLEIQPQNSKRMPGNSYLLGHPVQNGTRLDMRSEQG